MEHHLWCHNAQKCTDIPFLIEYGYRRLCKMNTSHKIQDKLGNSHDNLSTADCHQSFWRLLCIQCRCFNWHKSDSLALMCHTKCKYHFSSNILFSRHYKQLTMCISSSYLKIGYMERMYYRLLSHIRIFHMWGNLNFGWLCSLSLELQRGSCFQISYIREDSFDISIH